LNGPHGVISQKTELFITTSVRTSNLTHNLLLEPRVSLETTPFLSQRSADTVNNKELYEVIMLSGSHSKKIK
jgi:hypothetical protein